MCLGRTQLKTGWTRDQTAIFLQLCGPTTQRSNYELSSQIFILRPHRPAPGC
jgi:hypothetical protein